MKGVDKMKKSDVGKGLLSYLLGWIGALIVLLAMKNNTKRDVLNAGQGIVISVGNIILSGIASVLSQYIPFVSLGIYGLYLVVIIISIVNVVGDKDPKLPVIGNIAESLFSKQIAAAPEFVGVAPAPQANFDPNTGRPINNGANFDPNTGRPINNGVNFDPNTGQPINGQQNDAANPQPQDSNNTNV